MRPSARTTITDPLSSNRRSCDSDSSRPEAILPAMASVGLVSPRSTCESIGAETPERSARSRSDSPIPSRSARTRWPTSNIRPHVIAYGRMSLRLPREARRPQLLRAAPEGQTDRLRFRVAPGAEGHLRRDRVAAEAELRDVHAVAARTVAPRGRDRLHALAVKQEHDALHVL